MLLSNWNWWLVASDWWLVDRKNRSMFYVLCSMFKIPLRPDTSELIGMTYEIKR